MDNKLLSIIILVFCIVLFVNIFVFHVRKSMKENVKLEDFSIKEDIGEEVVSTNKNSVFSIVVKTIIGTIAILVVLLLIAIWIISGMERGRNEERKNENSVDSISMQGEVN